MKFKMVFARPGYMLAARFSLSAAALLSLV